MHKCYTLAVVFMLVMTSAACTSVSAVLDTYPIVKVGTVSAFIVTSESAPAGLAVGITADVDATASDPDGRPVTCKWTSNTECPGTFSPSDTSATVRFHADNPYAVCTLTLTVSDTPPGDPYPPTPKNTVTATVVLTEARTASGMGCSPVDGLCRLQPLVRIDSR